MKTVSSNLFLTVFVLLTTPALTSAEVFACPRVITASNNCSSAAFDGEGSIVTNCTEDTLALSGSFSIQSEFDADANVTAVPFLAGIPFRRYARNLGKVCDFATNDEGGECGTTGTYTLTEFSHDIPNTSYFRSVLGSLTIQLLLDDQEDCESGSSFLKQMGWAAVPFVGVGVCSYLRQRQLRRPKLVLESADSHFVEMQDMPPAGAMV